MTASCYSTIGPFFLKPLVDGCGDLTRASGRTAKGQHMILVGRIAEEGDKPVLNSIVEIWQPDAAGIFQHPLDPRSSEADPGFRGWGRARSNEDGRFEFRTVLPGASREPDGEVRCPHINLMVLAIGVTRRLVTTVFFGDRPESANDPVLNCVDDPVLRKRLFAVRDTARDAGAVPGYRFDIHLRGASETPFFLD